MPNKQAEKYKQKGNEAFKKGDHAMAIENYTYATECDPNCPIYYTNRSLAYFKMGQVEKSLRDANKAISKDPKWHKGFYRAGAACMQLKQYKEAMDFFNKAASIPASDNPIVKTYKKDAMSAKASMMDGMSVGDQYKQEGNELFKAGKPELAIEKYTDAILGCKADEIELKCQIYANRAACQRQLYHHDQVVADCTEALKLNKNYVKALIRRAQGYEALENFKKAYLDYKVAFLKSGDKAAGQSHTRVSGALRGIGIELPKIDTWAVEY